MRKLLLNTLLLGGFLLSGCQNTPPKADQTESGEAETVEENKMETIGQIDRLSPELDQIIPADAVIEVLAEGFDWTEGPVWVESQQALLFSDIPKNTIYRWREGSGIEIYLNPSGYTGDQKRGGEPGSNGLLLNDENQLVLCQHGDRRLAIMDASLDSPKPVFTTLVDKYEGKRFNSPNDAVFSSNNDLYFTDPPYGLVKRMEDPAKELDFQGVYKLTSDRDLVLLTKEMSRPNGIAFSPDEKKLYVANSDPERAIWMEFSLNDDGEIFQSKVLHDATSLVGKEKGLPDGMKVDAQGNLFATGPGGVWIFNGEGAHLGTIKTGEATANCAFDTEGSALYITADMYLLRVKLK